MLVYGLIVLAVLLSGIAAWQRYAHRNARSDLGDALERRAGGWLPDLGAVESWAPIGGLSPAMAAAPMCWFTCPKCASSCRTYSGGSGPSCPFCGLAMVQRGLDGQGFGVALVGGTGVAATAWPNMTAAAAAVFPIPIRANAVCPHADRGACTKCHTVGRSGAAPSGTMPLGVVQNNPKGAWRGATVPPAIPANAVQPTLIKEFGMEVAAAAGGVKVTGVMGNSYASRAGVVAGDIVIECNGTKVDYVTQFRQAVSKMVPESDAKITVLRNGRSLDFSIMVGEGEMEGFRPIQRPGTGQQ